MVSEASEGPLMGNHLNGLQAVRSFTPFRMTIKRRALGQPRMLLFFPPHLRMFSIMQKSDASTHDPIDRPGRINTPVQYIKGIGQKRAAILAERGIATV